MPPTSLLHKHALITGTRGLALSIGRAFAREGTDITFLARSPERGSSAASAIKQVNPTISSAFVLGDVRKAETWSSLKVSRPEQVEVEVEGKGEKDKRPNQGSSVDILINAAGISQQSALLSTSSDAINDIISTNLTGTILACRWFLLQQLRRKSTSNSTVDGTTNSSFTPVIINLSSLLALQGGRGSTVYAASKAGMLGLTRSLVSEMGQRGIRINAIAPGYIDTDMTKEMHPIAREKAMRSIPSGRFGTADEVAHAAVFLATNQYANNCVVNLDGGLSAVS